MRETGCAVIGLAADRSAAPMTRPCAADPSPVRAATSDADPREAQRTSNRTLPAERALPPPQYPAILGDPLPSPHATAASPDCAARHRRRPWTRQNPPGPNQPGWLRSRSAPRRVECCCGHRRRSPRRTRRRGASETEPAAPPSASQAVRALRPLRRRAETIARPARVRIRSRKPCTLARRRLFGWKVRLLTGLLQDVGKCAAPHGSRGGRRIGRHVPHLGTVVHMTDPRYVVVRSMVKPPAHGLPHLPVLPVDNGWPKPSARSYAHILRRRRHHSTSRSRST